MSVEIMQHQPVSLRALFIHQPRDPTGAETPIVIEHYHSAVSQARPHPRQDVAAGIVYIHIDVAQAKAAIGHLLASLLGKDSAQDLDIVQPQPSGQVEDGSFAGIGVLAAGLVTI